MPLLSLMSAAFLYAACQPDPPLQRGRTVLEDSAQVEKRGKLFYGMVKRAERDFAFDVPAGFQVCRSGV